ncbi:MAG: YicC family protein [Firmicutes bacterium]|nr:YicC family protein [Bacillota bacterium]
MIRSMTGFGRGESSDEARKFTVEIKSLNHRYSDIIIRMPKHLNYLEEKIKKMIRNKVKRGRVELYIGLENIGESDFDVKVNLSLAQSYKDALESLANELKIIDHISLDILSKFPEVLNLEKKEVDEDEVWSCLKAAIEEALDKMITMRISEGKELAKDIEERGNRVKEILEEVEKRCPEIVKEYKEKLWTRIEELLEGKYEVDENILANEVAIFADKSNINEEIVRLHSHIGQMVETLNSDISVGRKLDFLAQEMNREANTIGSKISDVEMTNNVVEIKSELEKIREQIQNIE